MRKEISSTLLVLSATAIALLLLASPLVVSNFLLQPIQAQTSMTFKTPTPAIGAFGSLTFDAHGTTSPSDPQSADITNGTIQLQGDNTYTGEISSGSFTNTTHRGKIFPEISFSARMNNDDYSVSTVCSTSGSNGITLSNQYGSQGYTGPVECSKGDGNTASSSSSSMTGTSAQDSDGDGDGIPDSSDRCPNNSHHRCYKEGGDTSSTTSSSTQQEQQPSSSSSGNGNQTG